jgi:hypothetical protein
MVRRRLGLSETSPGLTHCIGSIRAPRIRATRANPDRGEGDAGGTVSTARDRTDNQKQDRRQEVVEELPEHLPDHWLPTLP